MMVGGIFCDLQKAFDCVNHNTLLMKLEFYGITGINHKLIKSYLGQRVVLNKHSSSLCSNWSEITHGVQGSILGPLLFLLYIDLPQITNDNSKIVLFADDTSIIITNPNPTNFEKSVNKIFQHVNEWFSTNLLSLDLDKTHYMQFVTNNGSLIDLSILLLPLALQPAVGFGLLNNILPFFPVTNSLHLLHPSFIRLL
jgi:hypothetical protein